jgi:hypothetical protein
MPNQRLELRPPASCIIRVSFLMDPNGTGSRARAEYQGLRGSWRREVISVLAHVTAVEQVNSLNHNSHLKQATLNPGTPPKPDLYWWDVNGVGAFYTYDGTDLTVVLMGRVANPPAYSALLATAEGRV